MMRMVMVAVAAALALPVPAAYALSEWWAPSNASCPTFDSEDTCEAWCAADQKRCGGQAVCVVKIGPQESRPDCRAMENLGKPD
jgi:hypothetical protein